MKIIAICLGNICRSPLAEGILRHLSINNGLDLEIDSAGTSSYHIGENPCSGSIDIALINNIDISELRSRQFKLSDFENFDLILAMDTTNYNDIKKMARNQSDVDKIKMILDYAYPGQNRSVPDSYYTGNYEEVFSMLYKSCLQLVMQLKLNS